MLLLEGKGAKAVRGVIGAFGRCSHVEGELPREQDVWVDDLVSVVHEGRGRSGRGGAPPA